MQVVHILQYSLKKAGSPRPVYCLRTIVQASSLDVMACKGMIMQILENT